MHPDSHDPHDSYGYAHHPPGLNDEPSYRPDPLREVAEMHKVLLMRDLFTATPDTDLGSSDAQGSGALFAHPDRLRDRAESAQTAAIGLAVLGAPLAWWLAGLSWMYAVPLLASVVYAFRAVHFRRLYRRRVFNPMRTPLDIARARIEAVGYWTRPAYDERGAWLWVYGGARSVAVLHLRGDDDAYPLEVQNPRGGPWVLAAGVDGAVESVEALGAVVFGG
ncbi:MAG: hypothetical protein ACOYOB_16420 [Myxococcota bacterium]